MADTSQNADTLRGDSMATRWWVTAALAFGVLIATTADGFSQYGPGSSPGPKGKLPGYSKAGGYSGGLPGGYPGQDPQESGSQLQLAQMQARQKAVQGREAVLKANP